MCKKTKFQDTRTCVHIYARTVLCSIGTIQIFHWSFMWLCNTILVINVWWQVLCCCWNIPSLKGHNLIKITSINLLPLTDMSRLQLHDISVKGEKVRYLILIRWKRVVTSSKNVRSNFCVSEWLLFLNVKWANFSYTLARTSCISMMWWWCSLCTNQMHLVWFL